MVPLILFHFVLVHTDTEHYLLTQMAVENEYRLANEPHMGLCSLPSRTLIQHDPNAAHERNQLGGSRQNLIFHMEVGGGVAMGANREVKINSLVLQEES